MSIKPGARELLWAVPGALAFLALLLVTMHYHWGRNPATEQAFKTHRLELVARMQLDLALAGEAEKSAVLAVTDEDSQKFADQARNATAEVERARAELAHLMTEAAAPNQKDVLTQFDAAFAELRRVDTDLLTLAVRNTNLKASRLAFGPAANEVTAMDEALARLGMADANVARLADGARIAAWHLLALIPPHIAEESNQEMERMESHMDRQEREVAQSLAELAGLGKLVDNPDLAAVARSFAQFRQTKREILDLSRENTNVLSLSISLNQKRRMMLICQALLATLQQGMADEPVVGVSEHKISPR